MLKIIYLNNKTYLLFPILSEYTLLPSDFISHHHIHPVYHMLFILEGSGVLEQDHSSTPLQANDVLMINPLKKHIFKTKASQLYYFTVNFYLFPINDTQTVPLVLSTVPNLNQLTAEIKDFETLFDIKTKNSLISYNKEYIKSLEQDIISFKSSIQDFFIIPAEPNLLYMNKCFDFVTGIVTKYFSTQEESQDPIRCHDILVQRIAKFAQVNINSKLDLTHLSKLLGYHPSYLSSHFSKTTNMTISEYHSLKRLEKSCVYLKNSQMTITDIAMLLGYSSSQHFSTAFKKYKNIMPREYRSNIELF